MFSKNSKGRLMWGLLMVFLGGLYSFNAHATPQQILQAAIGVKNDPNLQMLKPAQKSGFIKAAIKQAAPNLGEPTAKKLATVINRLSKANIKAVLLAAANDHNHDRGLVANNIVAQFNGTISQDYIRTLLRRFDGMTQDQITIILP